MAAHGRTWRRSDVSGAEESSRQRVLPCKTAAQHSLQPCCGRLQRPTCFCGGLQQRRAHAEAPRAPTQTSPLLPALAALLLKHPGRRLRRRYRHKHWSAGAPETPC